MIRQLKHSLAAIGVLLCACNLANADMHAENMTQSGKQNGVIEHHDLEQNSAGDYQVTGTDPFLVFSLDTNNQHVADERKSRFISVDLSITNLPDTQSIAAELFFKPLSENAELVFDPLYRLRLSIPLASLYVDSGNLKIMLPDWVSLEANQALRLDIDACNRCQIRLATRPTLSAETSPLNSNEQSLPDINKIFAYRVFNGARPVNDDNQTLDPNTWLLNDLIRFDNSLKFDQTSNKSDPYLVSPDLDIDTSDLGGVLFSLDYPKASDEPRDYQIFYATDNHAFIEGASSGVRIKDDVNGRSEFVLPLQFLSESHPPARILERLRLDLLPTQDAAETLVLSEVRLIHKNQMDRYQSLIPARMIQSKQQRARGFRLLINVVKKVLSDPWFVLFYTLLFLLTAAAFWRQFKR